MNEIINWSPGVTLEAIEKQVVLKAYHFYRGNKTATSNSLGIAIRTLDSKLEKYELDSKAELQRETDGKTQRAKFLERQRFGLGTPDNINAPGNSGIDAANSRGNLGKIPAADSGVAKTSGDNGHRPDAGVRMESSLEPAEKHAVPLHKREKVQGVLSQQTAKSNHQRGR